MEDETVNKSSSTESPVDSQYIFLTKIFSLQQTLFSNILQHPVSVLGGVAIGPVSEGVGFKSGSKGSKSLNSTLT